MTRPRITMLGFTVPDALLQQINAADPLLRTQTNRFAWSLVRALRANGADVRLISVASVSDYPGNAALLWPLRRFQQDDVDGLLLPFVNLTILKHVTRWLACWLFAVPELRRHRPDWLLVHGVHSPFLWFAVAARRLVGFGVAVVLTDPPGVPVATDGRTKNFLRRLDRTVVTGALRRCDAVIPLALPLAVDFAPGVPHLVVEAILDAEATPPDETQPPGPASLVCAGGLHEAYGVRNLVEAVRGLPDPELRLFLYGKGHLEGWIREQHAQDSRIAAPRVLAPEELAGVYVSATVLVQPRQLDQGFVPYSFPSKLVEYLASGTVVVSTRLPSIPEDYQDVVVWADDSVEGLREALSQVLSWEPEQRAQFGREAAVFIRHTRTQEIQGARILAFLAGLQ